MVSKIFYKIFYNITLVPTLLYCGVYHTEIRN
nr:MAG TPA: hypothetical protein [Caudoviricetes sp.]